MTARNILIRNRAMILVLAILLICPVLIFSEPTGPNQMTYIENRTSSPQTAIEINSTGGTISVYNISAESQNTRWKGYVGNISGELSLSDGTGTLYNWDLGESFTAEVYASRNGSIDWSNINCTWALRGNLSNVLNRDIEEDENLALSHTSGNSPVDNISATFDARDNTGFDVGSITIPSNYCYTTNPYVANKSDSSYFEEILLSDNQSIIYAAVSESNAVGYNNETYDYQMIIPENGSVSFTGVTPYYFYIELI